ncbi:MAG TPA: pseudouridine synthase [Cryomorphaceae bacterium]|nr:pseudouridine synthase [Cryomorphaceae bacterium]
MHRYFAVYKPFGMLSQFSPEGDRQTLAALGDFDKDVYPVGRLDADSEGLLLLTNDKALNAALLDPNEKHFRTYYAQVEGEISHEAVEKLERGVEIRIKGKSHFTAPAQAVKMVDPTLPLRSTPIRFRKNVPTSWLELRITEGKNRQVRRMTAAVGLPTLRLVRWAIEDLNLADFEAGEVREFQKNEIVKLLKL